MALLPLAKCVLIIAAALFTLTRPSTSSPQLDPDEGAKWVLVHPGLIQEEVQSPKFFKKLYPLVFQFQNVTGLVQRIRSKDIPDDPTYNRFMHIVDDNYGETLNSLLHSFLYSVWSEDVDIKVECNRVESHFIGPRTSQDIVDKYFRKLRACFSGNFDDTADFLKIQKLPNCNGSYSTEVDSKLFGEGVDVQYRNHEGTIWANFIRSSMSLKQREVDFFIDMWKDALNDCQNKKIPKSLLPHSTFQSHLQKVFVELYKLHWTPTFEEPNLIEYYTTPITDCTFSPATTSMNVRILVPVRNKDTSNWKMSKFTPVPFFYRNDDKEDFICIATGFENMKTSSYLINEFDKLAYETDCHAGELCPLIEEEMSRVNPSLCISSVINQNYEDVIQNCPMQCDRVTKYHRQPIIKKFGPNEFLILGDIPKGVMVQCKSKRNELISNYTRYGPTLTLWLQIPCDCVLVDYPKKYELDGTCNLAVREVTSKIVLPLQWFDISSLKYLNLQSSWKTGVEFSLTTGMFHRLNEHGISLQSTVSPKTITGVDTNTNGNESSDGPGYMWICIICLILFGLTSALLCVALQVLKIQFSLTILTQKANQKVLYSALPSQTEEE